MCTFFYAKAKVVPSAMLDVKDMHPEKNKNVSLISTKSAFEGNFPLKYFN